MQWPDMNRYITYPWNIGWLRSDWRSCRSIAKATKVCSYIRCTVVKSPPSNAPASPRCPEGYDQQQSLTEQVAKWLLWIFRPSLKQFKHPWNNCAVPGYDMVHIYSDNLGAEQTGRCLVVSKPHSVLWQEISFLNGMTQSSVSSTVLKINLLRCLYSLTAHVIVK